MPDLEALIRKLETATVRQLMLARGATCYFIWCYLTPGPLLVSRPGLFILQYAGDWIYKDDGGRLDLKARAAR